MLGMIARCLDRARSTMIMVIVSRRLIWCVVSGQRPQFMIMGTRMMMDIGAGCRLQQRIAYVVRHRLARAVVTAVADPAGQLGHRSAFGVVCDRGRLRHRICINSENAGPAREHRFCHVFLRRPLHSGHFQNGGRSRSRHLLLHIASSNVCSQSPFRGRWQHYTPWGYGRVHGN